MKKVLALMFALLMVMSFAACGKNSDDKAEGNTATPDSAVVTTAVVESQPSKVQEYVDTKGEELVASMEQAFASSSGLTCKSTIEAVGNGFVINININELSGITEEQKAQLQEAYDAMDAQFEENFKTMQSGLPELEYMTVNVCDKDGNFLAAVKAGD